MVCREFLSDGPWRSDWPELQHGMLGSLSVEFGLQDNILTKQSVHTAHEAAPFIPHLDSVAPLLSDSCHRAHSAR